MRFAHISDIQIRNFKRHWEFKKSFRNLYESLKQQKVDMIVLVGDVAHTKTQISPEFVQMCSSLFRSLSDIAPLVLIPGNHDGNLNNLDRLDALTPIVEALDRKNIFYLKNSGVYDHGLVNFVVFSCFDSEEKWPTIKDINKEKINIGLYHGMLQGVELQNGILVDDAPHSMKDFLDKVDYLMLGDIHKMQLLDNTYRAAYCGSFPQQNYGETVEKGYLLWDIESKDKHEVDFVSLPNVCPFYTINFNGSIEGLDKLKIQKKSRIRVLCKQLDVFERQKLKDEINKLFEPKELKIIDESCADRQDIKLGALGVKIENLDDLTVQEKLIRHFLASNTLDEKLIQSILEINKKYNIQVRSNDDVLRNVQYRLTKMKWSNIGPYGENNEFDFSKHQGLLGVFGKNGTGKSTIVVDIPSYCIFNRISKNVTKNDLIINENKQGCSAEIEILVGKNLHTIKRTTNVYLKSGKKEGSPVYQGKTEVDYKVIHENGRVEIKNGLERADTDNEYIRKDFGTVEDFMDTSIAPQWQLLNFIDKGPTERQRLIGRYFDVDIFEKKHELAKKQLKEIKAQLAIYEKRNLTLDESDCTEDAMINASAIEALLKKKEFAEKLEKELEEMIATLQSQIVNIPSNNKLDESFLVNKIAGERKRIATYQDIQKEIKINIIKKNSFDISQLRNVQDSWKKVLELESRAESLEKGCKCKHEDGCPHFLKIKQFKSEANKLRDLLSMSERDVKVKIEEYNKILIDNNDYDALIESAQRMIQSFEDSQKTLNENKEQHIKNLDLSKQVSLHKTTLMSVKNDLKAVERDILAQSTRKGVLDARLQEIKKAQKESEILRKEYEAYDYFTQTMSKDGISRMIISENIGLINREIEKILSQGVEFTVELESAENGKAIEIYFKHPKSKKRLIELASGMEKTLSAIAIRAALVNVTTLPKSNLFVIDEAFDSLDSEYMSSLVAILDHLKKQFETVIIITHIDSLKDVVDYVVEIERDDAGYSKICD